jgi:hypothetical protein
VKREKKLPPLKINRKTFGGLIKTVTFATPNEKDQIHKKFLDKWMEKR